MRFILGLSAYVALAEAAPTVLETFVAKPSQQVDATLGLSELDQEGLTDADYETQLQSLDACDHETEADCQLYSLVMLNDGSTALVNLGFW